MDYLTAHPLPPDSRVYIDVGTNEGNSEWQQFAYLHDAKEIHDLLIKLGLPRQNSRLVIDEGAEHNEYYWSKRFPGAILWLGND